MKTFYKAGRLSMIYEKGALRYISSGRNELIRMIYPAVRDRNWETVIPRIVEEKIDRSNDTFTVKIRCLYEYDRIKFDAEYIIEGHYDNTLILVMNGEALETFEKNRIGFCVLHPIEPYAGQNCLIEHTDGTIEQSIFPEDISPHQVFRDIKSMKWVNKGITCQLQFEGDIFETEDQRNWTDNSYKTYSTPLSLPHPVTIEKGTKIYQKIIFSASGVTETFAAKDDIIHIELVPEEAYTFPSIGICRSSSGRELTLKEIKMLRAAGFSHYRTDIHLFSPDWPVAADLSLNESIELGWPLEVALFFTGDIKQQARTFAEWLYSRNPDIARVLLFHRDKPATPDDMAKEVITILREKNPDIRIATGTNANFAQLNRNRPGDTGNDYITYSIHPQEHASDDTTLVENLKGQEYSVRSAKNFAGRKGVVVSPVTLRKRFNPGISFIELPWEGEGVPPQIDLRQMTLFGACWTAGSLKYLCEADVDSITYFEAVGERGIMQGEKEPEWPEFFPSTKGMIFPVFHLFRYVLLHNDYNILKSISSDPLCADCFSMASDGEAKLVMVNYTDSEQNVKLEGLSGMFRMRSLNQTTLKEAVSDCRWTGIKDEKIYNSEKIITLQPYSLNFIEGWLKG